MEPSFPGRPERSPAARRSVLLLVLPWLIPVSLYLVLASRLIGTRIGFEYDEALWVESAVFLLHGDTGATPPFTHDWASWVRAFGKNWPLMIIPYEGTIKAFVVLPLFAAFGVSAEAARFAAVFLGALGIAGIVVLIRNEVSATAALIVGVATAIHPSYLDFTVFDKDGVAVWMAAMGLCAIALANHLRRRSVVSAGLLGLAAGLGVWARANVIWLIVAATVAALFVFGRRAIPSMREFVAIAIGGMAGAMPLIVYELRSHLATLRFIAETSQPLSLARIGFRIRALVELMVADGEQRRIWGNLPLAGWEMALGASMLALALLGLFLTPRFACLEIGRWRRAFAGCWVVLASIMLLSRLTISQHHLVAVLPLVIAVLAMLAVEMSLRQRGVVLPLSMAAAGLVLLSLTWYARIEAGLTQTGGHGVFSSGLQDVVFHLESHPVPPHRLKILNWGFQNSLYVLSAGSVYGSELFWGATRERSPRGLTWADEIRDGGTFLLFLFSSPPSPLSEGAEGFRDALRKYGGPRQRVTFYERSGMPLAALIEVPAASDDNGVVPRS
jgi:hypothetical protein